MAGSGEVVAITGSAQGVTQVFVVKGNGQKIPLKIGDTIDPGDIIITPLGVEVEVQVANGQVISISADQTVAFTAEMLDGTSHDIESASSDGAAIQSVIQAINEGRDIGDVLEETAAGLDGGSGNEGGSDAINLIRVIEEGGSPITYTYETGTPGETGGDLFSLPDELPPTAPSDTTGPTNVAGELPETLQDDTGVSQTDNLTNNKEPTLIGTTELSTDIVTVTLNGVTYDNTTIPAVIVNPDGTWSLTLTGANLPDGTYTPIITSTDLAGNTTTESGETFVVDASIPNGGVAPTVEITDDANNDGFVNLAESTADGNTVTDVKIGFDGTKVDVGDIVVATSGGVTKNITITATDKANGFVTTDYPSPVDGTSIKVDAFIKDAAGNQSATGTDTAKYDLSTLAGIQIEITEDANNDGFINATELQGTIGVRITLPATAVAGDLLTVTGTGSATQTVTLTAAQVTAGNVVLEFAAPANGTTFETTAQVTDPAGNKSAVVTDSAVIDTNPVGAPTVTIVEDTNNDGYINASELNGNIDTTVKLPAGAVAGDSLIVTVNGTAQPARVLTAADITAGTLSIPNITSPGEGQTLLVEARVDSIAGNTGATGSDSAIIDTSDLATGLAIEITEDINNDGFINSTELQGNTIGVRVTLPDEVAVGDTVTVSGSGNVNQVFTVTAAQITAGFIDVNFNPTGDNTTFVATATIKDVAGNTGGPVNDQATIQLTVAGAPIVTISEDVNNDGWINAAELNGPIDVAITLPATVNVGDSLIVDINGVQQTIVLTLAQVQASSVALTTPNPGEGVTLTVQAHVVDVAGNVGNTGSDSATIDTTPPAANAISGELPETVVDDTGSSNTDNITANRTPTLQGTTELATDKVEVTIDGKTYTATVTNDGTGKGLWSVPLTTSLPNGVYTPSIKVTDLAGNTTTKNGETFTVVPPTATAIVSEEGLVNGNPDTVGNTDTTNATVVTGEVNVNVGTVTLTAPTEGLTSGGVTVTWTGSGTNTIVGSANGVEVVRATINNDGDYTVTLSKAVDHATAGAEDVKSIGFGVVVTDAGGGTNTGTLNVNIEDDSPLVGQNAIVSALNGTANTNLSIVLDLSGSMNDPSGISGGGSRLNQAKLAITALINGYDKYGDVMVNITTFGTTAGLAGTNDGIWLTAANALTFLNNLSVYTGNNAGTNYDAALAEAMADFGNAGKIANGQNVLYFLSDGQPTTGDGRTNTLENRDGGNSNVGIDSTEEGIWKTHLNNNQINAFAISVGTGVTVTSMNPIAWDGSTGTERNAQVVTIAQLQTTLLETIVIKSTGTLVDGAISGFGADGGYVKDIAVDGTIYAYNQQTGLLTVTGTNHSTYDSNTHQVTITTATGGTLTLDMDDGNYTYLSSPTPTSATSSQFSYTLIDHDNDTATGAITFTNSTTLTGTAGNDTIIGGILDDVIVGGAGNDVIIGNTGNDTLTGGTGADVFRWELNDAGTTGSPARDTITDFNLTQGDTLDLKDLLIGENAGNLTNFLHFEQSGANTIVHVNHNGGFSGGFNANLDTQTITLNNTSLADLGGANDAAIIQSMLTNNQLIVDQ